MVRINKYLFVFFVLAIIWKMIEDFQPPPWASEDTDDEI